MLEVVAWSSFEIANFVVAAATPLLVFAGGFMLNRYLKSLDQAQWSRQKIIERRIKAFDEIVRSLNRIYCYFCYVGRWKDLQPPEVVELKRDLDETAYVNAPLFAPAFIGHYESLMDTCFATFGGWGEDAKLRTLVDRRKPAMASSWQSSWERCFVQDRDEASEPEVIKDAYKELVAHLALSIGVREVDSHLFRNARLPGNFRVGPAGQVADQAR